MNRIGDGKNIFGIDIKKLFENDGVKNKYNLKLLIIRCSAGLFAVVLTAILTLWVSGAFKRDDENELAGSFSELEGNTQWIDDTENEYNTEHISEEITENPPAQNGSENIECVDLSYKEHGELYVINKTGSPIVYDPHASYEKYYNREDMRPIVLVLHTETDKEYKGDSADIQGVVSIGGRITQQLSLAGVPAIHCSAKHNGDTDTDSYNNAEQSIEFYLEMYPSIKYILDVGVANEEYAAVGEFDRSYCAQILFDVCGQNYDTREQNLFLAVKLRSMLNRGNMSVAREIILSRSVLNSRFTPYYLTVRIGTENNTSKEAINSANALALALAEFMNKQ